MTWLYTYPDGGVTRVGGTLTGEAAVHLLFRRDDDLTEAQAREALCDGARDRQAAPPW